MAIYANIQAYIIFPGIWLSTFITASLALQSQSSSIRKENAAGKALKGLRTDWDVLYDAFRTDRTLKQWAEIGGCRSDEYNEYWKALPAFSLQRLKIPPNTRLLFYGNSYLDQVLQNILIANEDVLIKGGPFGGFEGDILEKHESEGLTGYLVKWDFTVNSTIVQVNNYEPLQLEENVANLKHFLQENSFDTAFFMNPHPLCYFRPCSTAGAFCDCMCECQNKYSKPCPSCNENLDGDFRGKRSDVSALWDAIHEAMRGKKLYEVEAWSTEKRNWFHSDEKLTVSTYPILAGHACNIADGCANSTVALDHQCQPGRLAFVSEAVIAKTKEAIE